MRMREGKKCRRNKTLATGPAGYNNTLLKSDVTRRDHVSVVMDSMNAGSRIVNFNRDGTVFA